MDEKKVREIVEEIIAPLREEIHRLMIDMTILKEDIQEMKGDIQEIKKNQEKMMQCLDFIVENLKEKDRNETIAGLAMNRCDKKVQEHEKRITKLELVSV